MLNSDSVRPTCRQPSHKECYQNLFQCGYTSVATVTTRVREWAEIHCYALSVIASATVYLARAPDGTLEDTIASQRTMLFKIQAQPLGDNPREDNPSTAFRLVASDLIEKDDQSPLKDDWETALQALQASIEFRAQTEPDKLSITLPVLSCFFVTNIGLPIFTLGFGIDRLQSERVFTPPHDVLSRHILEEARLLCHKLLETNDVVLQAPKRRRQLDPDVGTFVRLKKRWKWKEAEHWDWRAQLPAYFTDRMESLNTPYKELGYFVLLFRV